MTNNIDRNSQQNRSHQSKSPQNQGSDLPNHNKMGDGSQPSGDRNSDKQAMKHIQSGSQSRNGSRH